MYFLLNFREYSDDFCDVPDLELCLRNNDQEILEMEVDITPETDDDSYSSSFDETDSDDGKDEFRNNKNYLANEIKSGFKRIHIAHVDPVAEKLQSFLNAGILPKESMFYILLKNAVSYVDWLVKRKENHSLQFQWDNEVLQFLESLEYHGGRKVVNLLRGPGHDGEGPSGAVSGFDWKKWNWPLPGKTTRDKMYSGYSTENGIYAPLLQSFLQLSSEANSDILTLYEDSTVKIIPVALAKDGMQLKPGLLYDSRQGKIIGSTLNLDYNYIKQGEPEKDTLKSSIVQEAEAMCLTTLDAKFSLPVGVNHLTKGLTALDTFNMMKNETQEINVCLDHLQHSRTDSIIVQKTCCSHCAICTELGTVCDACSDKGHTVTEPALRPCDSCLEKEIQCIKAAVVCVSEDSESRNSGAQKELVRVNDEQSDPFLSIISPIPDGVHVAKRKRQSFSNWFLLVNNYRINLVQLRELRNDHALHSKLAPLVPLSAVRNRDRQDVESIMEISSPLVRKILTDNAKTVTHTVVPEKYRLREDNKSGVFKAPIGTCMGLLGHIFVSDVVRGKVYKVRANHYPANVTVEMDNLEHPIGVAVFKDILYCVESQRNTIAFKDLTGETVVDVNKLTVEKLKKKLKDIGAWNEDYKRKPKKYLQEKLREALNNRVASETNPTQQTTHRRNLPSHIDFDGEIKQPVALCFDQDGNMYVSTFTGAVYVVRLHCNLVSLKGTVVSSLQLNYTLLYGIVSLNNVVYVSAHEDNGGIYKITFDDDNCGLAEKVLSNGNSSCSRVHSLTTYTHNSFAFSDTGDSCIKTYNPTNNQVSVIVGNGTGTRDGSQAQFSQPTGICFDYETLFTADTSTGTLRMTTNVSSLLDYLEHLHLFGETFGLHTKKSTSVKVGISQAIEKLERVYSFDKKCVDAVTNLIGTTAVTQGPQGTVSSVVMEDERRILKSLRNINALLNRFNPSLIAKFSIKSLLTLVVENTFSEMRSGATDMPLQLEFDYRFSRAIKERLKRQCSTPFAYFTAPKSYYPQVFTSTNYKDLPKLHPPKAHRLSEKQVNEMRNWRAMYGQSVPQKTVRNMTTKDNPGTLPINLYAADSPTVQTIDFATLSESAAVSSAHKKTTETLYKLSQIVCVKTDSSDTHQLFVIALLQENVSVGMKRVKAKVFNQDPFNPVLFTEEEEKFVEVNNIVCALTCYNYHEDIVELNDSDLILLLDMLHHTNEVVTITEADTMRQTAVTEASVDEVQDQSTRIPRRRKRRFEDDFFYYE
jgi:hypothetical protein